MKLSRTIVILSGLLWLVAISAGTSALMEYDYTPSPTVESPPKWPAASSMKHAEDRPTIVLCAHPQCPCTGATIERLAALLDRSSVKPKTYIAFLRPSTLPGDWQEPSSLWQKANSIPDVTVLNDLDGKETKNFKAITSGHVLIYDRYGQLVYSGGITPGRGQSKDSIGFRAALSAVNERETTARTQVVFGCALTDSARAK